MDGECGREAAVVAAKWPNAATAAGAQVSKPVPKTRAKPAVTRKLNE